METHKYSCMEHSWTQKPGGLQSMGSQSQTGLNTYAPMCMSSWHSCHTEQLIQSPGSVLEVSDMIILQSELVT